MAKKLPLAEVGEAFDDAGKAFRNFKVPPYKGVIVRYHDEISGESVAAIVTKVHQPDEEFPQVNLAIFPEDGGSDSRKHIPYGPGQFGHWCWAFDTLTVPD